MKPPPALPPLVPCKFSWPSIRTNSAGEEYLDRDPHICVRRPGHDGDHKCACGRKITRAIVKEVHRGKH